MSWLSLGVTEGFEIFIYFLFAFDKDAMLVLWLFESWANVQLMRSFFSMLGVMLEATVWYLWSKAFFETAGFEPPLQGSWYRYPHCSAYEPAVGAFFFYQIFSWV
jgi:hypothetical protein